MPESCCTGVTIHNAAASGDLAEMKKVAAQAEQYLKGYGDVSAALEVLKVEIAKLEPSSERLVSSA